MFFFVWATGLGLASISHTRLRAYKHKGRSQQELQTFESCKTLRSSTVYTSRLRRRNSCGFGAVQLSIISRLLPPVEAPICNVSPSTRRVPWPYAAVASLSLSTSRLLWRFWILWIYVGSNRYMMDPMPRSGPHTFVDTHSLIECTE